MKREEPGRIRDVLDSMHDSAERESRRLFGPFKYALKGKDFQCSHCGNSLFHRAKGRTRAEFMTMVDLDFLEPEMTLLVCSECGVVFWVNEEPQRMA